MKAVASLVAFAILVMGSEPSWAACAKPKSSVSPLLDGQRSFCCEIISRPVKGAPGNLRWVAVSFYGGPPEGHLYVVDCGGNKVAEADLGDALGYGKRLRTIPPIAGAPTVGFTHISLIGTGMKDYSVALVQYRAGKARVLWTHGILDTRYPGDGRHEEYRTSWRFLQRRTQIEAVTVYTAFGTRRRVHRAPAEHYCLRTSLWRFVPCE